MNVKPLSCTPKKLLAVPCPTCRVGVGAYCEERPGKVLLLAHHHVERFWAANAEGAIDN